MRISVALASDQLDDLVDRALTGEDIVPEGVDGEFVRLVPIEARQTRFLLNAPADSERRSRNLPGSALT
jgi:hypothetical protein